MRVDSKLLRLILAVVSTVALACGRAPRPALEPVPVADDDRYDIPEPKVRQRDDYYDILDYTVLEQTAQLFDLPRNVRMLTGDPKQAMNVTPLDEIQNSSWFTNRIGSRPLSIDEIRRGPNQPQGPDLEHEWTITAGKTQGVTPGFTVRDARGDRFVIKFDPMSHPELATGAEAIGTRLFWALGYNTPENYLVSFDPALLRIDPKATVRLELGKRRPMTPDDLATILAKVPKLPDGNVRCIASRLLPGKPMGPFSMHGVRRDDPNDVIPHEHRRELRAYRTFCAWLNHNDSREINTLDMFVTDGDRHYVRHYLIDFGAILGSASTGVNLPSEGHENLFDVAAMSKSLFTLGLYRRPWIGIEYPNLPSVGTIEAEHFDPGSWKGNYPCPAFENETAQDVFWAARRIMAFDDEHIRAAVESAAFSDPAATEYLVRVIIARRDAVGRHAFGRVNPLDEFEIGDTPRRLLFADLAVRHGFAATRRYRAKIADTSGRRLAETEDEATAIPLDAAVTALGSPPADAWEDRLLHVEIRSGTGKQWSAPARVTLYLEPSGNLRVAAVERK